MSLNQLQSVCNCTAHLLAKCSSSIMVAAQANLVQFQEEEKARRLQARWAEDVNADLYSIVILCLFAGVILLLMIRAIKPSETLDDQVNIMLNSMRTRCELDEAQRRKVKMREAKRTVQRWLVEAKTKSVRKLSFRPRASTAQCPAGKQTNPEDETCSAKFSLSNLFGNGPKVPQRMATSSYNLNGGSNGAESLGNGLCQKHRAKSANFLTTPEIVVTASGIGKDGEEEEMGRGKSLSVSTSSSDGQSSVVTANGFTGQDSTTDD